MSRAVATYFTPDEVATHFNIDPETARRKFRTGQWPAVKIGGLWRISRQHLQQIEQGQVSTGRRKRKGIKQLVSDLAP